MSTAYPTPDPNGPHNPYAAPQPQGFGQPTPQPQPQPFESTDAASGGKGSCAKWGGIAAGVLAVLVLMASCLGGDSESDPAGVTETTSTAPLATQRDETTSAPAFTREEASAEPTTEEAAAPSSKAEDVPREYRNALRSAENYLEFSAFSYQGLYDQLTSEYADQFPADAAQYAVDNLQVDWNEQALKSAKQYLEFSPMSDAELYDQLVSEYGEQFTPEQAQYAIDHLDG